MSTGPASLVVRRLPPGSGSAGEHAGPCRHRDAGRVRSDGDRRRAAHCRRPVDTSFGVPVPGEIRPGATRVDDRRRQRARRERSDAGIRAHLPRAAHPRVCSQTVDNPVCCRGARWYPVVGPGLCGPGVDVAHQAAVDAPASGHSDALHPGPGAQPLTSADVGFPQDPQPRRRRRLVPPRRTKCTEGFWVRARSPDPGSSAAPGRAPATTAGTSTTGEEARHEVPGRAGHVRGSGGLDGPFAAGPSGDAGARRTAAGDRRRRAWSCPASTTRSRPRRTWPARSPRRAARWCPAGCSPRSPAACRPSRSRSSPRARGSTVTCGSARFTLPTMPVEDYPALPDLPAVAGSVGSDEFAAAVASVAVAAGRDDTLPVLTGVRVEIDGDRMTMVATDRYRLAVRELRWRPEAGLPAAVALVPARTLAEVAKSHDQRRRGDGGAGQRGPRRGHGRLRRRPAGEPRPGCSTASSRSTAACCRRSRRPRRWWTPPR